MITLIRFLDLVPGSEECIVCYEGYIVEGTVETLSCMLCEDAYNGIVSSVEVVDGILKVYALEKKDE